MRRRLPSLNALRSFEAAARHGSMTRAADALGVTHGAVSRQVRGLEASLGLSLLENRRGRLQLTEAGTRLLGVLDDAFGRIARGIDEIAAQASTDIAVSSFGTFAMRWLIPRLHRFQTAKPDLIVRLTTSDSDVDAMQGAFDLAIRVGGPSAFSDDVDVVPLFAEFAGPVMAPALALRHGIATAAALTRAPLLHTTTRRAAWPEWFAAQDIAMPTEIGEAQSFEHVYFMLEAATAGLGVAIGFWHLVADDVKSGRLVAPFGFMPTGRQYVALLPRPVSGSQSAARIFVQWLQEEAAVFMHDQPPMQSAGR